jgi:hypothetical protein
MNSIKMLLNTPTHCMIEVFFKAISKTISKTSTLEGSRLIAGFLKV